MGEGAIVSGNSEGDEPVGGAETTIGSMYNELNRMKEHHRKQIAKLNERMEFHHRELNLIDRFLMEDSVQMMEGKTAPIPERIR